MPRPHTYGKKKPSTLGASSIFGTSSPASLRSHSAQIPLADLISELSALRFPVQVKDEVPDLKEPDSHIPSSNSEAEEGPNNAIDETATKSTDDPSNRSPQIADHPETFCLDAIALKPLQDAYKADCDRELPITAWAELLPEGAEVVKIAEASFAEVYRVTINGMSSILKLIQLKIASDPMSMESETAIEVETVISEVRLMNALTQLPGFVTFKDVHLIHGKPCEAIIEAYNSFDYSTTSSSFPDPNLFRPSSLFLAVELGDAGTVLDEAPLQKINEVWDVLIGVIVSLAVAEYNFEFEHRDLHENNVCINFGQPSVPKALSRRHKYGLSGWTVTVLDYGLSRAKLENGDVVYNDLEKTLWVFQGSDGKSQFDTYRRMRNHLFTEGRTMKPKKWHNESSRNSNNGHSWKEFIPYTNVLWIKYLLGYVKENFKKNSGDAGELRMFENATKDLSSRLDYRSSVSKGAFSTALEVYQYVIQEGWITKEQVEEMSGVTKETEE